MFQATCCSELRRQLLAAKAALREQEGRCRQLLVAVGSRLRRAEALRVQQLGTVMAALLGLEARLRQEQANIRQQLARRDAVIRSQALEIARLRRAARKELRGTLYKDYQHNPVLECVNQILLRDRDDDDPTPTSASTPTCASIKEEDEEEEQPAPPPPPPPPPPPKLSPPTKAQHLEEKACLLMASRRLTLVRNVELEEVDRKEEPKRTFQKANRVPPALPPKPPQLGSLLLARSKKNYIKNHGNLSPHPLQIRQRQAEPEPDKPRQRQILSNGSLKVAQHLKRADVKVGCSVSKLITGSDSGSIVTELTQEVPHSNDKYYVRSFKRESETLTCQQWPRNGVLISKTDQTMTFSIFKYFWNGSLRELNTEPKYQKL